LSDRADRYPPVEVTSEQFERTVASLLGGLSSSQGSEVEIRHQDPVEGVDGIYVIDVTARFEALGVAFLVLFEAKLTGRPVERSAIQILADKVRSTGAHKGVVVSNAGFQRGAIAYASVRGIALARLVDESMTIEMRAQNMPPVPLSGRLVAIWVSGSDEGTIRFTTITGNPDYFAQMLDLPEG
jgi:restriction system protein